MKPLKTNLRKKKDAEVVTLTATINTGATGKPELANAPVTLADLVLHGTELSTALNSEAAAKAEWMARRSERMAKSKTARSDIRLYGQYAYIRFLGDKAKLNELGLDVADFGGALGALPAPTNLRSRPGKVNQTVSLIWNPVRGRESHELQCAESATGPWTEVYRGKKTRAICPDLQSGKEYFFRVRAYGAAGPGEWSDITATRAK